MGLPLSADCAKQFHVDVTEGARNAPEDTGIVIVNWNSWAETIEALEAVFRMEGFCGPVVVCDNASTDGSLDRISDWAQGLLCSIPQNGAPEIRDLVIPPVPRNFSSRRITLDQVKQWQLSKSDNTVRLWLVDCGANRGFGAGSNVGISVLSKLPDMEWFWLLNCDALPASDAYRKLRSSLPSHARPVICGSALLEYWEPDKVQSCGANFNRVFCSMRDNLKGEPAARLSDYSDVMSVDYPVGASILINRAFYKQVGPMSEDYFLYFEELDWVSRFSWPSKAFVVSSCLVYHKGGATTEAGSSFRDRGQLADYYFLRSRVIYSCRHLSLGSLVAFFSGAIALLRRGVFGDHGAVANALSAVVDGFRVARK